MKYASRLLTLIAALFGFFSCSSAPPEILFVDSVLFLSSGPGQTEPRESLRLFVAVRDDDGPSDIVAVLISHEENELVWNLDERTWTSLEFGGDQWFGHTMLQSPRGAALPRGRFTAIVEDAAGATVRRDFFVRSEADVADPAEIVVEEGALVVLSTSPVILRGYTIAGELSFSRSLPPGPVEQSVTDELRRADVERLYLFTDQDGVSAVSGPYEPPR